MIIYWYHTGPLIIDIIAGKDEGENLQIIHKYRIKSVLKVEIDIITNIAVSCISQAAILAIMYVENLKTDQFLSIMSHQLINFMIIFTLLILPISSSQIKGNMSNKFILQ
jgi:hypothetical protein